MKTVPWERGQELKARVDRLETMEESVDGDGCPDWSSVRGGSGRQAVSRICFVGDLAVGMSENGASRGTDSIGFGVSSRAGRYGEG